MKDLKPLKWAITLFHTYENKEYKEKHDQEVYCELTTINILSNIINEKKYFSESEVEDAKNAINNFHISQVEKDALIKIIDNPYPFNSFIKKAKQFTNSKKQEMFCLISDIFITKDPLNRNVKSYLYDLGEKLDISIHKRNNLISSLRDTYQELKILFNTNHNFVCRNTMCKDIVSSEYTQIESFYEKKEDYFSGKEGIIGSVLMIAALKNINIDTPKFLFVLWISSILSKHDLQKASFIGSQLVTNYKRYEKIIDWNVVNLNNLIEQHLAEEKNDLKLGEVKSSSQDFAEKIIQHVFANDEHKKISKFQRSLKS
jgi:hypothetical protein